jgi:mono/diheme cytochrome c family protein
MKVIKWTALTLSALLILLFSMVVLIYIATELRINKTYQVSTSSISIPSDKDSLNEGKRLYLSLGCVDCHGQNLAGKVFTDDTGIGTLSGNNLTAGAGGIGSRYQDTDFVRAIRHGVAPNQKSLRVMPSQYYANLNDEQLGALIAYIRNAAPIDNNPNLHLGPLLRFRLISGQAPILPAEIIDHQTPAPLIAQPAATPEYGKYLSKTCSRCHHEDFAGGIIPTAPLDAPEAANITPHTCAGIGLWSEADFFKAMRKGLRPNGTEISTYMPWTNYSQMTDTELKALWQYLKTLPAVDNRK